MCWTKWHNNDHKCIGRFQTRSRQYKLQEIISNGTMEEIDNFEIINCTGTNVNYTWVEDGIYSYDGHVSGFKQYISAYCEECGGRWVESPENWKEIQGEHGTDIDWRIL